MFTLAALTRHTDLPRRVLQFWADKEVLIPIELAPSGDAPRLYPQRELEVARLLRPFAQMASPVGIIALLAVVFRDILERERLEPEECEKSLMAALAAARAGKPAFMVVQIFPKSTAKEEFEAAGFSGDFFARLFPETSAQEIGETVAAQMELRPKLPLVVINLTDALRPSEKRAAKWPDDKE